MPRPSASASAGIPTRPRVKSKECFPTLLIARQEQAEPYLQALTQDGFEVSLVDQPTRGDLRAQTRTFEAIVLDHELFQDRCLSTLLRWRGQGVQSRIVVLLPGDTAPLIKASCLDAGADAYLTHPVGAAELLAQLRALLRRDEQPGSPIRKTHDLELNLALRTVKRAGKPIPLTPREFDLLHFLLLHQGKVVTRAMIREHLYEDAESRGSNVVDVYIRYLRGKIDKGFDYPLILTRWGQGYLFRAERV